MMRVLWCIGVGLLLAAGSGMETRGQSSAASYFHEAAQQYVAGNRAAAQRAVEQGLQVAPSDPRLNALREKLEQGQQPTEQQDSSATASGNRSQQDSDSSSSEASEDGDESSSSSGEQGSEQSSDQNQSDAGSSQSQASAQQSGSFTPTDSSSQAEPRPRGGGAPRDTLSREQAERLLRALEGQERQLLRELRTRSSSPRSVEKDW